MSQSVPPLGKHVPKHRQAPSRLPSRTAVRTLLVLSSVAVVGTGTAVAGGALVLAPQESAAAGVAAAAATPTAEPSAPAAIVPEAAASTAAVPEAAVPSAEQRTSGADLEAERPDIVSRSDRRGVADPRKRAALSLGGDNLMDRAEDSSGEDPRTIAQALLPEFGFSASQFDCLDSLWTKESGWRVDADNPSSSAYGIPQALPGSKMSSYGDDWATNPVTQIRWGLNYISDRYGSPCGAWGFSQSNGWY